MRLNEVSYRNFMSFGDDVQCLQLDGQGLVFVEGDNRDDPQAESNGAGKSSVVEGVVWALTGQTLRGLKGDEVINAQTGKDCSVQLAGEYIGKEFLIHRYRRVQRKSGLKFFYGAHELTEMDVKATQDKINEVLGIDFNVLVNTSVFGQGAHWRFSELNDAARKALLDKLLGTDAIARAHEIAKGWYKEAAAEVDSNEQEILQARVKLTNHEDTLKLLKEQRLKDRQQAINEASSRYGDAKIATANLEGQAPGNVKLIKSDIRGVEHGLKSVKVVLQKAVDKAGDARGAVTVADERRFEVARRVEDIEERIASPAARTDTCDACGSEVTARTLTAHRNRLKARLGALNTDAARATRECKLARAKYQKLDDERQSVLQTVTSLEGKLQGLRVALSEAQEHASRVQAAQQRREELREAWRALKLAKNKRTNAETALVGAMAGTVDRIESLQAVRLGLKRQEAEYRFWVEGFGNAGVKSHLLDYVVPLLNHRSHKLAKNLMRGLAVEFASQSHTKAGAARDKLDVIVSNTHGAGVHKGNSSGERRKVDIVIAHVLQSIERDRARSGVNVSWWDEVFESLDETSCEAVMEMLRDDNRPSVFVISHLEWLKAHFPRVLRVVKAGGFSRLEWA